MEWPTIQASLEFRLPGNPAANNEEVIDKCVEVMTSAIQAVLAATAPER